MSGVGIFVRWPLALEGSTINPDEKSNVRFFEGNYPCSGKLHYYDRKIIFLEWLGFLWFSIL